MIAQINKPARWWQVSINLIAASHEELPKAPPRCAPSDVSSNNSRPERRGFYCLSPPTADVGSVLETGPGKGKLVALRWL